MFIQEASIKLRSKHIHKHIHKHTHMHTLTHMKKGRHMEK